jgi:pectate lyase
VKRREFLAAPLALAACVGLPPPQRPADGWAGVERLNFADGIRPEHRFEIYSRPELDRALALGDTPKLLRIHGRIDLSGRRGRAEFVDAAFDFDAYCRAYAPEAWGRRALSGPLEDARKSSAARQAAAIVVKIPSRTVIAGATSDAGFIDGTLMLQDTQEVILSNLRLHGVRDLFPAWDPLDGASGEWNSEYDAVSLRRARRVWIDHCEFESAYPARDRIFGRLYETNDGLLDITLASDLVTVSWCRFSHHDKTMLIGGSDRHTGDEGHLRVSLHHNLWEHCAERTPRVRYGRVHVVNNLYVVGPNFGYSIGLGRECNIVSEANAWEAPADFDAARVLRNWGGKRFSDRGSLVNGRPLGLGAEEPSFAPPPVVGLLAATEVATRVRAGAGVRREL